MCFFLLFHDGAGGVFIRNEGLLENIWTYMEQVALYQNVMGLLFF